jgi:UDP-N-acetylglucosamine 2-epimerase
MKICTIIGVRPQFIKATAVSRAIKKKEGQRPIFSEKKKGAVPNFPIEEILIHTGQHYDDGMSAVFFRELEIPEPKYNLEIGSGPHGRQTGRMLAAIEEVLLAEQPDWVLVYGDTNSTLAGVLAAAKLHIPIAHVEAGLRSFNRRMPEEINRIVADQLSTLLFCPSQVAVDNLAAEGIGGNPGRAPHFPSEKKGRCPSFSIEKKGAVPIFPTVVVTGDVMADALQFAAAKAAAQSEILDRLGIQPQRYILATVHRAENTDDPQRLSHIMAALEELAEREPVILPVHPRTQKILEATHPSRLTSDSSHLTPRAARLTPDASQSTTGRRAHPDTSSCPHREGVGGGRPSPKTSGLKLIDPLGYFDIIALEKSARMLLTDSGGMQKEAYWFGVPCVTLRDETEWVETVASGWNVLTGADRSRIVTAVRTFKPPAARPPLYGDGQAAEKIVHTLSVKGGRP